jgi:hypothetical protein
LDCKYAAERLKEKLDLTIRTRFLKAAREIWTRKLFFDCVFFILTWDFGSQLLTRRFFYFHAEKEVEEEAPRIARQRCVEGQVRIAKRFPRRRTNRCFLIPQLRRQKEVKTQQAWRQIAGESRGSQSGSSQGRQKREERQKKSFEGEKPQREIREQGKSCKSAVEGEKHWKAGEKQEAIGNAEEISRTTQKREGTAKILATEESRATSFAVTQKEFPSQQVAASSIEYPQTLWKQPKAKCLAAKAKCVAQKKKRDTEKAKFDSQETFCWEKAVCREEAAGTSTWAVSGEATWSLAITPTEKTKLVARQKLSSWLPETFAFISETLVIEEPPSATTKIASQPEKIRESIKVAGCEEESTP